MPPTLAEVVKGADHIGLVNIRKAEVYDVIDAEGVISCGVIYEGDWVDSLTGDSGHIEFSSTQVLEVRALYLVYLAGKLLPRKLMSTNSISEAHRLHRLEREQLCEHSKDLPRTIYTPSIFVDERNVADLFKTGVWLEFPRFSESELDEIVIFPTELSIGGRLISRDQFLEEFFDEYKHQVIRTAGHSLIVFRAVDWKQYCSRLVELVSVQRDGQVPNSNTQASFCQSKRNVRQ